MSDIHALCLEYFTQMITAMEVEALMTDRADLKAKARQGRYALTLIREEWKGGPHGDD
jgi:hypothetical protein